MGAYSLGIVLNFVFLFTSADLIRALKVYGSGCMVHDKYWHVSGDRLGGFGVKHVSQKMFMNGCLLSRDSVGLFFHICRIDKSFDCV